MLLNVRKATLISDIVTNNMKWDGYLGKYKVSVINAGQKTAVVRT